MKYLVYYVFISIIFTLQDGSIKVLSELSSTDIPEYILEITATDKGNVVSPKTAKVTIIVTNLNLPPTFINEPFEKEIPEDTQPGSVVKQITSTDPDGTALIYSLVSTNVPFKINATTGVIETTEKLDREMKSEYIITVSVTDGEATIVTTCTIIVTDVNDLAPVFTEVCYQKTLAENTLTDQVIVTVEAADGDKGVNAMVLYMVVNGNEDGKFELDSVSASLSI